MQNPAAHTVTKGHANIPMRKRQGVFALATWTTAIYA